MPSAIEDWSQVGEQLCARGEKLLVIEASAGGAICAAITAVPGASAWFSGGLVAYNDELKCGLLGVRAASIERYGAVSVEVVNEMLRGAPGSAQWILAESGIYGPAGERANKPVGEIVMGLKYRRRIELNRLQLSGSRPALRDQIQAHSAQWLHNQTRLAEAR